MRPYRPDFARFPAMEGLTTNATNAKINKWSLDWFYYIDHNSDQNVFPIETKSSPFLSFWDTMKYVQTYIVRMNIKLQRF
jgi:hypothetical protein